MAHYTNEEKESEMKIEDKYQGTVETLFVALNDFTKGTTVPWLVVQKAMGCTRRDKGGWTIINRVRRRLRVERQIVTMADPTVGLRFLTDTEVAYVIPEYRGRRSRRQIDRGIRETDAADVAQLPHHAAVALALSRRHMREVRLAEGQGRKEVRMLTQATRR